MFRPFHFIATFAIKTIVGYFNLPTNLVSLFKILYTTSIMLTGTVGFIPTIMGLILLRTLIILGFSMFKPLTFWLVRFTFL